VQHRISRTILLGCDNNQQTSPCIVFFDTHSIALAHITTPRCTLPQATLEPLLASAVAAETTAAYDRLSLLGLASSRQFWSSAGKEGLDAAKLFAVKAGSVEHAEIVAEFAKTLPHAIVDKLERVENGYLQEGFQLQAKTLERQVGAADYNAATMRQMLFHGTEAVEAIINSTDGHGFLPLLSGSRVGAIHGDGTYFARDAKYSNDYARTIGNGQKQMLVAEVLVGRWTKGRKGMSVYPLLPGEMYKKYNSLVDHVVNPSIFVVQHSNEAYPAYLLTYHT